MSKNVKKLMKNHIFMALFSLFAMITICFQSDLNHSSLVLAILLSKPRSSLEYG